MAAENGEDLRVYIDYKSPYAYLAKDPAVYDYRAQFGCRVQGLTASISYIRVLGQPLRRNDHQGRPRALYSYMDARRTRENRRGITVRGRKSYSRIHRLDRDDSMRAAGVFRKFKRFSHS